MNRRFLEKTIVAVILLTSLTGQVFARAVLASSTPAANAAVTTRLQQVQLRFSERVEVKLISVIGPKGQVTFTLTLDPVDEKQVYVTFNAPLAAGKYSVDWQVLGAGRQKSHGSFGFTVR